MDLKLTTDQKMIQTLAKDFREKEIEPIAVQLDKDGIIPPDMVKKMAKANLIEPTVSHKYGGAGVDHLSKILALEEMGKAGVGLQWLMGITGETLEKVGTPEQKQKYLPGLCRGEFLSSLSFTEASTGSDPKMIKTQVAPDGDGYVLNGTKAFCTNGAFDGPLITFANNPEGRLTALLIDKNCPGYTHSKPFELMGFGGWDVVELYFDNIRVPKSGIVTKYGEGFGLLVQHIASERIPWCAVLLGLAQAALDEAITYSKQRFRREIPIAKTESIQFILAEMAARVNAARWVVYRGASLMDEDADMSVEGAKAKLLVSETALWVTEMGLQIHGCYGFIRDMKINRLYRSAKAGKVIIGSNEIERSIIAGPLVR